MPTDLNCFRHNYDSRAWHTISYLFNGKNATFPFRILAYTTHGRTEKTLYPFVLKIGKLHKLKEIELKYCDSRSDSYESDSYEIGNL